MKRIVFLVLIATLATLDVLAQGKQWTLRECEDYAISNSISIKQSEVARVKQTYELSTARNRRLPDLSASLGENLSFGRGLTAENTYDNTDIILRLLKIFCHSLKVQAAQFDVLRNLKACEQGYTRLKLERGIAGIRIIVCVLCRQTTSERQVFSQ